MNGFRQLHRDGRQTTIVRSGQCWDVRFHWDGESSLVAVVPFDLEEAKAMSKTALEKEHSHMCDAECRDWELF